MPRSDSGPAPGEARPSTPTFAPGRVPPLRVGAGEILTGVERLLLPIPEAGLEIALIDFGGDGPLALLHHANGFCGALFAEVAERLRDRFHVVAMDARGHGDSSRPPSEAGRAGFDWSVMAADLVAVARALLRETGEARIELGVGHSFGGTLTLLAAASHPGRFGGVVLLDPVIIPRMSEEEALERAEQVGLAAGARRRRHTWPTRSAARAYCLERPLWRSWTERAVDLYVGEGLRDTADGEVALKCAGEVEACIFEGGHSSDVFAATRGLETPVHLLWATRGSFPRAIYEELIGGFAGPATIADGDCGHLMVMESPDVVLEAIEDQGRALSAT